jgi:hypothetical protein
MLKMLFIYIASIYNIFRTIMTRLVISGEDLEDFRECYQGLAERIQTMSDTLRKVTAGSRVNTFVARTQLKSIELSLLEMDNWMRRFERVSEEHEL